MLEIRIFHSTIYYDYSTKASIQGSFNEPNGAHVKVNDGYFGFSEFINALHAIFFAGQQMITAGIHRITTTMGFHLSCTELKSGRMSALDSSLSVVMPPPFSIWLRVSWLFGIPYGSYFICAAFLTISLYQGP